MKNLLSLAVFASALVSVSAPAFALDGVDEAKTSAKNERRAENQEYKAQRDASEGNVRGAERHADNAARDEHKSRHEAHRARREGF